jgi:hypothetical protein
MQSACNRHQTWCAPEVLIGFPSPGLRTTRTILVKGASSAALCDAAREVTTGLVDTMPSQAHALVGLAGRRDNERVG